MSEMLACGHPDKNRACGDCLGEAVEEVHRLELQIEGIKKVFLKVHTCMIGACWRCQAGAVVERILNETEKPKAAPKGEHGNWIVDGDRDICGKCGARSSPTM